MEKYIDFDIDEVKELQDAYEETMNYILTTLPDVNWDSRLETSDYFTKEHNINFNSLKIAELQNMLDQLNDENNFFEYIVEPDEAIDTLSGLITYLKIKWEVRNYTGCILRHQKEGRVILREIEGRYVMPNRQPLPYSQNILECIKETNYEELKKGI